MENDTWSNFRIGDFRIGSHITAAEKSFINSPDEVDTSLKAFVRSLKKKTLTKL